MSTGEIIILICKVIILIIKGYKPKKATRIIADKYGIDFFELWDEVLKKV